MCQIKYLFDYRQMTHYLDKAYNNQREELDAGYFPDMSVFDEAEYEAMENHKYPDIYPWLETSKILER